MAEVRQIPSAVGAFEAQVFDLSSITRQMTSQLAMQRRTQLEARKEAEKSLAEIANSKAGARSQDIPYLQDKENELKNYFSQNINRLKPGTGEYRKFNELKTDYIYEIQRSKNEKEKQVRFATYASANASKEKLSDETREIIETQKLAINDPRRTQFKKKFNDGREAGIDELDLGDLNKFTLFDETELQRSIKASPNATYDVKDVEFNKNFKGLKSPYPITITGTTRITDPFTVTREYINFVNKTPDTLDKYTKEFNALTDEQKEAITEEMKAMKDVFKAAGAADFQFEDDATPGVTNAFEYGLFTNLKRNLPRDLGQTVSASVGSLFKVRSYAKRASDPKAEPIDAVMSKEIDAGTINWDKWTSEMNTLGGRATMGFQLPPYEMLPIKDGQGTAIIRTAIKDKDGKLVTNIDKAVALAPKRTKVVLDELNGNYFYEEKKSYDFRKTNPSFKANVQNAWNDMKAAQYDADARELIERNLKIQPSAGAVSPGEGGRK